MGRSYRTQTSTEEVRSPWSTAEAKLRGVGATDDEVETFRHEWEFIDKPSILNASPQALAMVLADMRAGGSLLTADELPPLANADELAAVEPTDEMLAAVAAAEGFSAGDADSELSPDTPEQGTPVVLEPGDTVLVVAPETAEHPAQGSYEEAYAAADDLYGSEDVASRTIPATVEWIGDGLAAVARAHVVLNREQTSESPRKGMVEAAQAVLDAGTGG